MVVALLLRISDHARRPAPEVHATDEDDATQVVPRVGPRVGAG
jgi:hypothetical protein